jgi:hypothetical protein
LPELKADPDWAGAARAFVAGLAAQPDADGRVEFIDACRAEMGEQVYPGFIKLLVAVAALGDTQVRVLAAEALAHALATARLPSTRVAAFGGGGLAALASFPRGGLSTHLRNVGPVEYLCVWLTRDLGDGPLEPAAFRTALRHLLALFDASPRAASLYRAKLAADAANPMEGLHSQASRSVVRALVAAWEGGAGPEAAAGRAADAAGTASRAHDPFASLLR